MVSEVRIAKFDHKIRYRLSGLFSTSETYHIVLYNKSVNFVCVDRAAELMTQTGDVVTLRVAKQGAMYHGLATLLNEPSPTVPRRKSLLSQPTLPHCAQA
jgi:hypothetical protein